LKYKLTLTSCSFEFGRRDQMFYTDSKGELFIGPVKQVEIGKTYEIEATEKRLGTMYRYITSWSDANPRDSSPKQ